ncbi:hypothetical protein [Pseudomonas sp. 6D_7.1_Bac1]|uniref:hypothetical protein n=1 Tax=Pseudomonas sp. 6D_7.1_Bac1 TaxID=2971615 RepID=UPI0021C583E6|nr:hypothetical protein [Pseudomonas sp. 6D_7.1_Bac1]MCU1753198.1 hypothetical protein [Pseudomonas sp. 6D_7.1_Bac1]
MLKLKRAQRTFGYATPKLLWRGIVRANPYNAVCIEMFQGLGRKQGSLRQRLPVSDFDVRVLKVVSVALVNVVTCPDWAVFCSQSTVGRATGAGKDAF